MNLVIVESPAKAKTINKYLGSNYTVLASYGHLGYQALSQGAALCLIGQKSTIYFEL